MLSFLPAINFTNTELAILHQKMSDPVIVKYLSMLALSESNDLLTHGEPQENESAEALLRRQAHVRGRIEAIETLLTISKQETPTEGDGNFAG